MYLANKNANVEGETTPKHDQGKSYGEVSIVFSFNFVSYTDKKENLIFLIYKEIQSGVAKSYMRKGFLIYEEMRKYLNIYEEAVSHI
jgi:hypothetical protein